MSELLELLLEAMFNLAGILLDFSFLWPDTRAGRIFWSIILPLLGGLIWWELR